MANNTREIKRRIKSVRNIGQITKAMELVSAAKMRKAQIAAVGSRPYATLSAEILQNLVERNGLTMHPLINRVLPEYEPLPIQKVLIILITSNRGLAGAFNSNVINRALNMVRQGKEQFDFITIGKKGADMIHRQNYNIVATFAAKDKGFTIMDAAPIAAIAIEEFLSFIYEKVFIVYTDFVSTLVQKPNILQLLPFEGKGERGKGQGQDENILFEPSSEDVLKTLVIRTVEFAVYQTLVEAAASEHSARMVAMRNANEAAGELIEDLSLTYNQARQAGITRELSEISAAKLAMEG